MDLYLRTFYSVTLWYENYTGCLQRAKETCEVEKQPDFPKIEKKTLKKKFEGSRYVCMSKDITREAEIMILEMVRVYMGHCKAKSPSC